MFFLPSFVFAKEHPKKQKAIETIAIDEVISIVNEKYIKSLSNDFLIENAIMGLMNAVDKHSDYFSPDDYKEFKINSSGSFSGIGVEVAKEGFDIKIMSVFPHSPALEAGIKVGDILLEINGTQTYNLTLPQVANLTRGSEGVLDIKISRPKSEGLKGVIDLKVKKQKISMQSVFYKMQDGILFMKITSFNHDTFLNVQNVLRSIEKKYNISKIKGFVIDFRDNPGGFLDQAIDLSNLFLPANNKISTLYAKGNTKIADFSSSGDNVIPLDIPMVILINEGTASAAEIVTGAMQDNKRAVVVGTKSYGKGSVQDFFELFSIPGAAIKLTFALYHTPSGKSIEGVGIEPNVALSAGEFSVKAGPVLNVADDPVVLYAFMLAKNRSDYDKIINTSMQRARSTFVAKSLNLVPKYASASVSGLFSSPKSMVLISLLSKTPLHPKGFNVAFAMNPVRFNKTFKF